MGGLVTYNTKEWLYSAIDSSDEKLVK